MLNTTEGEATRSRLVICVGDSITEGKSSSNYVELLRQRMISAGFRFINAGVRGDLSYNVLRRLSEVIAHKPDFVTIQVGTNDVIYTLSIFGV